MFTVYVLFPLASGSLTQIKSSQPAAQHNADEIRTPPEPTL